MTAESSAAADNGQQASVDLRRGLAGIVIGYVVASLVLFAMRIWAGGIEGGDPGAWRVALGLVAPTDHTWAGLVGALLGGLGGALGTGVLRRAGFVRSLLGAAIGYPLGAALTMAVRQAFGLDPYQAGPVYVIGVFTSLMAYMWGIGAWTYWFGYMIGRPTPADDHSGHGARRWTDYLTFNTDHKVIGVQYLVTTFAFMLIGGAFAEMIRGELANPGLQVFTETVGFNRAISLHGIIMLLVFIIPVFAGLANYVLPIMIGAPDMAFPRLNALSFWMLLFGGGIFLSSIPIGAFEAGWTNYAPLSSAAGAADVSIGQLAFVLGVQIAGTSSILTAINFIVTIVAMRAPGMSMWDMPLLAWANLTTSMLVVAGTPFIAGSQFMVLFDALMGMKFFTAGKGGDPIAYQHIFWFYSHPAVYIMMLPGFGIISEVITTHARKPIFGYRALAMSTLAIGFLGFTVWAHHMFTSGMAPWLRLPMMVLTMLIAVPTGIKVLGWSATLWKGRIHMTTPMLFALGFLFMFTVGGITGVMLAAVPLDQHFQDTYFVVAHFHYVLFGGSVSTVFAGVYHWYPKMTGRMYDERLGRTHFWLNFVGMNLTFFPMHWIGTLGMPRRVADYGPLAEQVPVIHGWNLIATVGAIIQGVAIVVFLYNMVHSARAGGRVSGNPWRSLTLEWLVTSPPPLFNFHDTPRVVGPPYDFGVPGARHAIVFDRDGKPMHGATVEEVERDGRPMHGATVEEGTT